MHAKGYIVTQTIVLQGNFVQLVDKKNRTIGRSFRIRGECLKILTIEAKREGISVNALLNQVLEGYCTYHRHFSRYGGISLTKNLLTRILEECPQKAIKEIAQEEGSQTVMDLFKTFGLDFTYENMIFFLSIILSKYGNWFKYEHHKKNSTEIFYIRHSLGDNGSVFISELLSTIFKKLNKKMKIEATGETLYLETHLS